MTPFTPEKHKKWDSKLAVTRKL